MEENYHSVFSYYFKEEPLLVKYSSRIWNALEEGDTCCEIEPEDKKQLEKSTYVSTSVRDLAKPFILFKNQIYYQRYFSYEYEIILAIKRLNTSSNQGANIFGNSFIEDLINTKNIVNQYFMSDNGSDASSVVGAIDWQQIAVLNGLFQYFSIITGGPGTGKTTTVAKLLAVIFNLRPEAQVLLTAQTGKAATRLRESLLDAREKLDLSDGVRNCFDQVMTGTLHRMLGVRPSRSDFKYNKDRPWRYDLVIIDESSMVDAALLSKTLSAVKTGAKVVLLGDKNQLSSVEAGTVFGDLCDSASLNVDFYTSDTITFFSHFASVTGFKMPLKSKSKSGLYDKITELKKSYRFSSDLGLGKFAKLVLGGVDVQAIDYGEKPKDQGVYIRESIDGDATKELMMMYKDYIQEPDIKLALQKLNKVRFLVATRIGSVGLESVNYLIESFLNSNDLIDTRSRFYVNRPVIINKNDYQLGLFNGDIGLIRRNERGQVKVFFEDAELGIKALEPALIKSMETVFAMTIHKSQGSEFQNVVIVLPEKADAKLLNRQLLYTGITRAKEKALIISKQEVLSACIKQVVNRSSGIKNLLEVYG